MTADVTKAAYIFLAIPYAICFAKDYFRKTASCWRAIFKHLKWPLTCFAAIAAGAFSVGSRHFKLTPMLP